MFALFLLFLTVSSAEASAISSDADLLASAEQAFAEGVALRDDAVKARSAFARAAAGYDELWRRGHHGPELALNRANAHRLATHLPAAIAALNEGLAVTPWNRPLQEALEDARSAVGYPLTGDLAAQCRPPAFTGIGTRMSPTEAWLIAGVLWLFACAGVARFAMTRRLPWLVASGAGIVGLGVLSWFWLEDSRLRTQANEHPLLVLTEDAILRKGNAEAYPAKLEAKLPRGVEVRKLAERGGWVQVQLAGGTVGWLPANSVLRANLREL